MNIIAIVPCGLETVACAEAEELVGRKPSQGKGWISFEVAHIEDAWIYTYRAQSVLKVLIGGSQKVHDRNLEKALASLCGDIPWNELAPQAASFAARGFKIGYEDTPSSEIAAMLGGLVKKITSWTVNLGKPDIVVSAVVAFDSLLIGIDIGGEDLGIRPYRLFQAGQAIKAPLAYGLVRMSGWKPQTALLDPFCQAGTVSIEAGLWASKMSPHRFAKERLLFYSSRLFDSRVVKEVIDAQDQMRCAPKGSIIAMDASFPSISASKKNAKLAGVENVIAFSKMDVEWLDVKHAGQSVDAVATVPPTPTRMLSVAKLQGMYREFLHQSAYVLHKQGKVVILVKSLDLWKELIDREGFTIAGQQVVYQGKEQWTIVKLQLGRRPITKHQSIIGKVLLS